MKKAYYLIPSVLICSTLSALPESGEVASGQAEFHSPDARTLKITASDKAIINYRQFNIGEAELVEFVQPSAKATVLNRIKGGDASRILGTLNANGRVFLVNPSGIYFGPNASVNTGSFIASTLNIRDEDFLKDKFRFYREPGSEYSSIINEGSVAASPEGFIAFFAPVIENRGSIMARAGKVVLAAAERVVLDFSGDGLIQFTVDGDLKQALIENYGNIEAANGNVAISLRTARDAIKMVVNTDGITPANSIEESNGIIRLVSRSKIAADQVMIEGGDGSKLDVQGTIDASNANNKGGTVHLLGENVQLIGAQIDASGASGGGTVLIGGDYQGKGELRTAQYSVMDSTSEIRADAYHAGDGGKVILWADDTTFFDGKIFARGGLNGGDGGFVETSGKIDLGVETGYVNTSAPLGKFGDWLLDPASITIANAGGGTIAQASAPNCATGGGVSISVATMQAAASNVALCAQNAANSTITVNNAFTMPVGISLSMTAGSTNVGTITLNANITTRGQPISLTGLTVIGANVVLDTTNAGGSPSGGNISFSNTINGSGARTLTLTGGTGGTVTMSGAVGGTTALTTLTATGATITQSSTARTTGALSYTGSTAINVGGNVTTSGGIITMTGPVTASGSPTFDSTNAGGTAAGANISFSSTLNGATAVTLRAGTAGSVTFTGAVGNTAPLTNLAFTSAVLIQIGNNITVTGANPLTFPSPVSLTGTSTITSNNANVSFNSTLNGAQALTIAGGSGTTTFTGAVGGTAALTSLSATAATVTQSSTAVTTGALSYTGSTAINVAGNITTSGGIVTMTGPVTVSGNPTIDTTNAGGTAAGANISFSSTVNGATALTLRAGTGGVVTFSNTVGNTAPPTNLAFTSANLIQIANNITVSGANPLSFPSPVSLIGPVTINSNNANISFGSTLNGAQTLTLTGGSGTTTFTGAVGGTTPLTSLSATAATITQTSTAKTTGALSYTGSTAINLGSNVTTSGGIITMTGPVTLNGSVVADTTNAGGTAAGANITFTSTINGANNLTLNGGTGGTVSFGAVGGTSAPTTLLATGATINQNSTAKTTGALSYTGSTAINVAGNITTSGGIVTMTGPVVISTTPTIDTTNAGGTPAGANISFSSTVNGATSLTLRAGTGGNVIFSGAVGNSTPLTNLVFTSANLIQVGNNITVSGANPLVFSSPVSLTGTSLITTNNANLTFSSTLNGAQALTLAAGTGSITFTGAVGGGTALNSLTISNATNVTANAITTGSLTQSAGTGTSTFNGALNITSTPGLSLTGTNFTFNALSTLTGSAAATITQSGTLTISAGDNFSLASGAFVQNGAGSNSIGANITSTSGSISFATAVSLTGPVTLQNSTGGNITLSGTVNGAQTLNLSSPGIITFSSAVGGTTPLSSMTASGATVTQSSTVKTTGTVSYTGSSAINVGGNITTSGNIISMTGPVAISGNPTFDSTNAGGSAAGANITFSSTVNGATALTLRAGTAGNVIFSGAVGNTAPLTNLTFTSANQVQIGNNITVSGANPLNFSVPVSLTGTSVITSNNADINFNSTIDGAQSLTLVAGTGSITFTGAVGGTTRLNVLTITSATNVTANAITATSIVQSAGSGTTTLNGVVDTNGAAGINLTGTNFAINNNITTTNGGALTINHTGTLTISPSAVLNLSGGFFDNGSGGGTTNLAGSITTNGQNLTFSNPVLVVGTASLSTGAGVGNISFLSTLNGTQNLTLASGGGNIIFTGTVGGTSPLGTVTINATNNVTANAFSAAVYNQTAGTGTSTFNGAVSLSGASGFSLVGTNAAFNSSLTTAAGGPASINISNNLVLSATAVFSLDGAFTQTGAGSDQLAGSITTTNDNIQFAGPVTLSGTTVLNTGAGIGNILFSSTVDGPGGLTMTAGTGNITLSAAAGSLTRLGAVTINSATNVSTLGILAASINQASQATGTSAYAGELNTNAAAGIALNSATLTVNGNLITTSAGPVSLTHAGTLSLTAGASTSITSTFTESGTGGVNLSGTVATVNTAISFTNAITLTGTTSVNSGSGAGSVTFSSTIDGGQNLTVASGSGNTIFGGIVGGGTRLNNLTISGANNVTASNISAATISQLNGSGTTTFNGALNTNAVGGISLIGSGFTFNNTVTSTAAGTLAIANSGTLNLTSSAICSIGGAFTQSAIGGVTLSGQITAGGAIAFSGPITLSGTGVLSTAAASQNITLANTVDGGGNLTLAAGGGSIAFQAAVGSGTRIGALTISSALNVSTLGITASSISQLAGTGTTIVTGDLDTNGVSGMTFILNNFTRTGGFATTNGGPVTVTNSGTLTSVSTGTRVVDGFYLQNGTGPVIYSGTILTNNQPISFASPITLNGDVTLNSGTTGGNITLSGTVNGAHILTLAAGTGDTLLSGIIGGTTPLTSLTFSSAHNITAQNAITAQAILQSAGTGTSIFNGTMSTSTTSGINLTGSAFQFNNTVTTTNAGLFSLSNSGTALFAANFTIDGTFTQSGAGGVSLNASIATTGNTLTIGSPITLTGNSALNSGVAGSGVLTVSSTIDGAHTLSLTSGTGNTVVSGAIGSSAALSSLTASGNSISLASIGTAVTAGVTGAVTLTATSSLNFTGANYNAHTQTYSAPVANITAVPLATFATSGNSIDFSAAPLFIGTNANLTINSSNGAITLNTVDAGTNSGRTVTLSSGSGAITLANIGTSGNGEIAALNLTGGDILFHGNVFTNAISITSANPHIISLGGDITTIGTPITFPSSVNIIRDNANNSTLTTNGGNITFQGKIDGDIAGTRRLTLASGSGDVFFNSNIGDSANLDQLNVTSAHNVTTAAVSVGSISQAAGTGTTTFSGQVTTTTGLGLNLIGTNFTFSSGVNTLTNNGNFLVTNSGTLTLNSGVLWNLGGEFLQNGSGPVSLAVHIASNNSIEFDSPITLIGTTILDTSALSQQILLGSTVDGGFDLTMNAGTSNITVNGAMGSINRIGNLVIGSATNITTQPISAASINFTWGTGTFSFTGALNTNALAGITLTGTNIFSTLGTITTSNGGPLSVSTTGTTSGTSGGPTVVSGSITQSSTGTGFIGGTFISLTGNITTVHNIHLNAPLTVDTSAGGGNIIVQGTVDGSFPFTINAGAGNVDLQQAVGAATRLGAIVINNANNVITQAVTAASIRQVTGTGTTTFNGALDTNAVAGISVSTNSIVRGAAITTTGSGPCAFTISNAGTFTSTAAGTITTAGAFSQSGSGAVAFGGTINVSNHNISFAGPITLSADAVLNAGSLAGDTILSSTVQGAHALTISGGAGSVTLGGNVGTALTPLTSVIINNALNVTTQAITAGTIQQGAGTGTSTFNGALTTNTAAGIQLIGTAFNFNAPFTTTALGAFTLANSGLATMSAAATGSVAAAFLQNGTGTTQLSNAITSTGSTIHFSGPVTLSGSASLTTTNQAITLAGTLDSTVSTPGSLTLSSGSGAFTLGANAGLSHPLVNLTITTAGNVTTQAISASTITQSAGTGTTLFNSDLTTTGLGGINLTSSVFTFLGSATTSNGGPIAIANAGILTTTTGKTLFGDGGFSQTGAGAVHLASNISANNNNVSFVSPITLLTNVVLNSGTSAGDITVATVDGAFDLTFTPGRDIFAGAIGGTTRVGTVTATAARNINASSINAAAIFQLAGTGTTSLTGNINTNTATGINLTGVNFVRSGSIITTNGGSFVVTHSGLVTGTSINTTSIDGSYTANGVGLSAAHNLAGAITARTGISISSAITLLSDPGNLTPVTLDSSGGNGNISIANTINNDVNAPHTLILIAGAGDVSLSSAIGGSRPIGPLTLGNVNNITAVAISADSIQQQMSATIGGTGTFNGSIITMGSTGIVLTGTSLAFNSNITTASNGPMTLTVSNQLSLASGITASLDGPFTQSGAGAVLLGGTITTTNDNISFASTVTLNGISSLNTGSGVGDITFSSGVNGAFPLALTAGTGNVSLQGVGSSTPLSAFTVNSAASILANASIAVAGPIALTTSGALTFNSTVTTTAGGAITLANGGALTISSPIISASSLTQTQTGSPTTTLHANLTSTGNIQLASNTTLTNNITMNSGGGAIILAGTVNSDATARNLTLTPGTGSITLSSALGGVNPLSAFQITNAANVTAANISAATIQQLAGTGLSHFTGTLTTTALGGVSLTGSQFTLDNIVTTTNGGPLSIVHTGTLTLNALPALGSHSLSGAFSESGSGGVSTAANITLSSQPVTFNDAVTLTGDSTVTSGGGNITYASSINGPFCLTLLAGVGTIQLDGPIGASTNLGCLTLTGANILQNNSITSTGAVQETGAIILGGNITTTANDITLTGNVTIIATNTSLSTGSGVGGGTIHVTGTINPDVSTRNLTLQTGTTGTLTLDSGVGTIVALHNFTATSGTINLNNFGSTSAGATGTATVTATSSNINFTGTTYANATQIYTAPGSFNFQASPANPQTMTSNGNPISFVTGAMTIANNLTINSNGGTVTLTDLNGTVANTQVLNINAALGTVNVQHIGNLVCLNAINITAGLLNAPFATCPVISFTPTTASFIPTVVSPLNPTTYFSPVVITADNTVFSFSTCPGGNNVIFNSTLDSDAIGNARNIVFNMCGNTLTFNGSVGGTAPLTSITVNDDTGVNVNAAMTVGAYTQSTARVGATTTFSNGLTTVTNAGPTPTSGNVNITAPNITLQGSYNIAGTVTLDNSGTLLATGVGCTVAGAFDQTGAGSTTISGTVHTLDNAISFNGPVTLNGDFAANSVSATGNSISFGSTISGNFDLTCTAGTGDITLSGNLGTALNRLDDVIFVSDHNLSTQSIFAATITQLAGSGTASFVGTLDTIGPSGILIIGTNISRNGATVTANGGNLVLTNSGTITGNPGNTVNLDGAFIQNGSSINLLNVAGTITAKNGISFVAPLSFVGPVVFDTSTGGGNIVLNNTIDGAQSLTLSAGAGNVSLVSAAGGTTPLTTLVLGDLHNFTSSAISSTSIAQAMATTITGTVTFNGALSMTGAAGIVLTAPQFALNNNITTTGTGPLTLTHTGLLNFASGIAVSLSGAFSESGGGTVSLMGSMATANQNITFADPVSLSGSTILSTGAGAGNIAFSSTLDGSQSLDLTAGAGSISFGGSVGSASTLGSITIHSVNGIAYPSVNAASINQIANTGTTTINGPLMTNTVSGISLTGGAFTQNGTITTTNLGGFAIQHSGTLTMAVGSGATVSGSYTDSLSSTGPVSARGTITAGGTISFAGSGAITLAAATSLNSGVSNGGITINGTIDGANDLTLNASEDFIILAANVGIGTRIGTLTVSSVSNFDAQKITAGSLVQSTGLGTTHFHDTIDVNGVGGISLVGSIFTFDNTVTASAGPFTLTNSGLATFNTGANVSLATDFMQQGTGPVHLANTITTTNGVIDLGSNITLTGTTAMNSSAGNKSILLSGLIDGANALTLTSGSGNITALQNIGSITRLGSFSLSSTGIVSTQGVNAASITQTGSAATTYNFDLNTNAVGGINLTAGAITLLGNVTTTSAGPITIANAGLLTTTVGKTLSGDGGFSQTGAGAVTLGTTVLANSAPISFVSPITLTSNVSLNSLSSGSGGANITVTTVDGSFALNFIVGSGDISAGAIGGTTPLSSVIATSVHNNNAHNITAGTIQQLAGSGTTTLNGDITSTTSTGITLVGTNFTRVGKIITLNGGSFTVTNSGLITGTMINTTSIDGFYIQNGAGTTNFAGTITAREGISFTGPIVMLADGTLDSSSGNGPITLSNTIDNFDLITPHQLTLIAASGNIVISSPIGSSKPLSNIKLTGGSVSINNIGTALATGLTGTLQIPDPLSLVTVNQIIFNGTVVNANAQTYAALTSFNMNAGAATSIFSNGQPITFTTGTIQLAASTNLTINSVSGMTGGNITTADIHAGASSLRTLALNAGTGIGAPGTIQPGTIGLAGNGEFASVSLTGVLTLPNNISANSITFTPTGGMSVGGNLTTVNSSLTFPTALTLTGSRTFSTSGGSISFTSTLDGDANDTRSLSLVAGTGTVTFGNAVGGTFRLNTLAIASAGNVTATAAGASLTVGSIIQASGTGTTQFSNSVSTRAGGGFQFTGNNLHFDSTSTLTTTNNGPMIIANTGILTLAGTVTLSAGLSQSGSGAVAFSGSIAAGQPVSFAAPMTLSGTPSINTSSNGQSITFSNAVNGPGALSLTAGTGDIAMNGTVGGSVPLGAVTIVSADDITLSPLTASSLTFTNFTGTANYQSITTTGAAGVNFTGNNFIRNGTLTIGGGGSLIVTNSGFIQGFSTNTTAIDGSYTQNGTGPYDLAGTITVGANISLASAITLTGTASLASTGNGTITLSNVIDGNQNLTLAAGSGVINLNGNIGNTDRIGALMISSAGNVTTQLINAASITQTAGSGTTTFSGALNTNGTSGITLAGTHFVRGSNWTTTNSGPITITIPVGGTLVSTAAGTINSAGAFRQLGAGSVSLSQAINTTSANIIFSGPVTLAGLTTLNTGGAGAGDINFGSTLDGAFNLILASGTGNISMQSAVGGTTRLGTITINNANNVTFQPLKAAALSQLTGSGATTLNGATDINTAAGISINATDVTLNGTLTTTNNGVVTINNSGVFTAAATSSVAGNFTQVGVGSTVLSGTVNSTGGLISFAGAVSASGTPQLTTASQPISFSSTLDGPSIGTGNLTVNAGVAGDITFTGVIGSTNRLGNLLISNARNVSMHAITASSITQSAGAGTTSILGNINTNNVAGISLLGTAFNINGSIITTSSGPMSVNHSGLLTLIAGSSTLIDGPFSESGTGTVSMSGILHTSSADITFNNPITLLNPTTLNSDGSGDITLVSPVDGATDLTLDSGANNITALAAIGGITPINNFLIVDTNNATFLVINAQTITQQAGTGTTTFNGAISTSNVNGISLTGNAFAFNAPVTTTGSGPVVINNIGTVTIAAGSTFNLTGPFSQTGAGSVALSANITIDNDTILFTGPVTLGNTVALMTNTATGNVTFLNTLNGTQNLTIAVGTGSIAFDQPVGGSVLLGNLIVTGATNLTSQAISASSINLSGISNLASFGILSTIGASGIVLSGNSFTFNQNVTTTNSGPLTITNTGTVTFSPLDIVTVSGAFNQNGSGLVLAGGSLITNNQTVNFSSAVFLNGNYSINTGTTGANVTFASDLDGPFNLTIATGVGDVVAQKAIGDGGALQNITITSRDITLNGVGTTLAGDTGTLSLTATNLINLSNSFYTAGTQVYSAGTGVHFTNGALTNLTSLGGPISFTSGPITLSSANDLSVVTNNGAFSYVSIAGTTFENVTINTGTGTAFMSPIIGPHINNVTVNAGQVEFIGLINAVNANFEAVGAIFNAAAPVAINSTNTATFNALNGNVGTLSSPILVNTSNQIFAGAGGSPTSLADFNGTSADNTVHSIPSNPPCEIIFNGVIIKTCTPTPTPGPAAVAQVKVFRFPFAVPGFDSSFFNLASDYFFFIDFLDDRYVRKDNLMYYRAAVKKSWSFFGGKAHATSQLETLSEDMFENHWSNPVLQFIDNSLPNTVNF